MTRILLTVLFLCLCACTQPQPSAPPEQRKAAAVRTPSPIMMLELNDPDVQSHIVKDVHDATANTPWRWSAQEPTVKLQLSTRDNVKFSTDFAIWDDGFKQTGPITLTFNVNGHELDKVRYTSPGSKHFEKPVPSDWLPATGDTPVSIAIDKVYVSPTDGFKAGVILTRIGFKK